MGNVFLKVLEKSLNFFVQKWVRTLRAVHSSQFVLVMFVFVFVFVFFFIFLASNLLLVFVTEFPVCQHCLV